MRLAKDYQTIDVQLRSIGKTFGMVGAESIALRENLIGLFGSLDEFVDQVSFYQQNFLTDAQRLSMIKTSVDAELSRLGLSGVDTLGEFKAVVDGLDLTTTAGQELFAALMKVAPAFYQVEQLQAQRPQKAVETARSRSQAGNPAARGAGQGRKRWRRSAQMELDAMDASLRGLQQEVWRAQDIAAAKDKLLQAYQRERSELEQTISKFGELAAKLRDYRQTLFSGEQQGITANRRSST
jgi:hypothetical protein